MKVGGRLRCIGSPQHLKSRFGNYIELEVFMVITREAGFLCACLKLNTRFMVIKTNILCFQVKPTEVSSADLQSLCQAIQEMLLDIPSQPRSLLNDLEICIGGTDSTTGNTSVAEISLTREMIGLIGRWLGNEERVKTLITCAPVYDGASQEQLSEQLFRDGTREPFF